MLVHSVTIHATILKLIITCRILKRKLTILFTGSILLRETTCRDYFAESLERDCLSTCSGNINTIGLQALTSPLRIMLKVFHIRYQLYK